MPIQAKLPDGTILKFPDGVTQEMVDGAVQEHLGSVIASSSPGFLSGAKGTAAAVGDITAGLLKVPARAVLAVGGKVTDPSRSLQDTWDTAGQAIEETYPSFGKDMENNPGYTVPMKPFELYGQGAEWLAEHASMGNKDVQGAINIGANFLPIPFVKPAGKVLGKVIENIDPGLKNVQPNIPKPNIEAIKPEDPLSSPSGPPRRPGGVGAFDDIAASQGAPRELPSEPNKVMDNVVDRILNDEERAKYYDVQEILQRRQAELEQEVKRQTTLDMGAADRARQENAPTGYSDWQVNKASEEAAQTHDFLKRAQQSEIDATPFGGRPTQYGMTDTGGRVDEHGIPIRADLSMEAQHLQDPLQRNLWGEELPRKSEQEAPLGITHAIDSLPDLPWKESARDIAIGRLKDPLITPAGGIKGPRGQRGVIDVQAIGEAIEGFKKKVKSAYDVIDSFTGAFYPREMEHIKNEISDPKSRYGIALMSPSEFHRLAVGRSEEIKNSPSGDNRRGGIRKALQSPEGLEQIPQLWIDTKDGKFYVKGHEGRHRMDVFQDMGIDKVPVMISHPTIRWGENPTRPSLLWSEAYDGRGPGFKSSGFPEILNHQYKNGQKINVSVGQRGGIDPDLLTLGLASKVGKYLDSRTAKNLPLVQGIPKDTITHPTTPETIAQKTEIRNKTEASKLLKQLAPEYSSVTTPEEAIALAKDAKDINKNPARDVTISGINGQVFLHRNNPVLNFVRYATQQWRNATTKFSRDYVTSKDGVATLLQKLTKSEKIQAMEALREAGKAQLELTPENIHKLGLSENANKFILSVRKALDAQWEMAADSLQMAGRDAFKPRAGYFPAIAAGSYKSLVGVMKDGTFVTKAIAQADTRWDHSKLIEHYKKQLGQEAVVVPLGRQGMHQTGITNNLFNGFNDVINTIAKHDPRFAELQTVALMKLNEAHHKLKGFDVHEMKKKGIEGFTGDSPIRTREQNAQDMSKALINFLEQGAEYYSGQKALNDISKVITSPETAHLKNTRGVVEQYTKHVLGRDLNPIGNAVNWVVDMPFRALGISHKIPLSATRGLRTAVGLHMMGLWNPTFTALQLTQVLTGAWPKMQDLGGKLNMVSEVNKSAMTTPSQLAVLATTHRMGKPFPEFIPQHMKEAFQYALDHGITEFSELETATSATRNKKLTQAEKVAATPIVVGERLTRPPVFMMFADIFHKFGLENQEAFMAAHNATNMAMGDYHPYERPQIYSQLGVLGEFGGALTTFKHNALTNYWVTGHNAISKDLNGNRHLLPMVMALAGVALFQGLTGAPGYQEMDDIYQWATAHLGKRQNIAQAGLESAPDWFKHGILSATTGLDFQSRASMSNVLPDIAGSSLSPQLSVVADIGMKLYDYNKYRDQHSFNDLMMALSPSGVKGMTENALMTNPQGQVVNTSGQLMFNEPRTPGQQTARKWFGVRPLNETVSKEDVYVTSKSLKEREDRESDYAFRFRQAFASGDQKGMENLSQKYLEIGGDPQVLFNSPELIQAMQQATQDQRTRMAGQLAATQRSLRRWQELHPGKK